MKDGREGGRDDGMQGGGKRKEPMCSEKNRKREPSAGNVLSRAAAATWH